MNAAGENERWGCPLASTHPKSTRKRVGVIRTVRRTPRQGHARRGEQEVGLGSTHSSTLSFSPWYTNAPNDLHPPSAHPHAVPVGMQVCA